jgi:hypothetical protein
MKAEYCVEPTVKVYVDPACEIPDKMRLDDADVDIEVGEDSFLKKVKVVYTGLLIKTMERGGAEGKRTLIIPSYPKINNRAFNVMLFLFNKIQVDAGHSALNVAKLKSLEPTISPETLEEEDCWKNCRKTYETASHIGVAGVGAVSFDDLEKKFQHHVKAYANFTDAKNTDDSIAKYERLYKVVESFFDGKGPDFDQNVSNFMIKFDSNFTPKHFEELRQLRNRCVHSKDKNHVTSGDVELLEEVSGKTEKLEQIAELLLKHK